MPGNPTSCLSNCYILLAPMLRRMARQPAPAGRSVEVPLAARIRSPRGRVQVHTVRVVDGKAVPAFKESGDSASAGFMWRHNFLYGIAKKIDYKPDPGMRIFGDAIKVH